MTIIDRSPIGLRERWRAPRDGVRTAAECLSQVVDQPVRLAHVKSAGDPQDKINGVAISPAIARFRGGAKVMATCLESQQGAGRRAPR